MKKGMRYQESESWHQIKGAGSGCLCRIDHGACWMGSVVYMRMLYHVYMRGIWMDELLAF